MQLNRQNIIRAGIGLVLLIALGATLRSCDKRKQKNITDTALTKDEQVAIIIDPNTGTVTTVRRNRKDKKSTTEVQRPIDGSREIRIGVSPEGRVIVTARTKGFIFEPGLSFGEAEALRIGLDAQWAFYRRWGAISGLSLDLSSRNKLSIYAGVNYLLPFKYTKNTSVFLAYDTRKNIYAGLRVRF